MNKSSISSTKIIKYCFIVLILFAFDCFPQSFHITNSCVVENTDCNLIKLVIMLPLAQTNQYQTVRNLNTNDGGICDIPETNDKYLRWELTSGLPEPGQSKKIGYEFDIDLNTFDFDFNTVTNIFPYDTTSNTYKWYTGKSGVYVDPDNDTIKNIGNTIWTKSTDIIDYARRCYEYVAQNFQYLNPLTGLHTLADILHDGGGDCGNLSSIYVSLLRYKGIPSRHVVTIRPDASYHVWAEFYLENYGWIPVDVTYKNLNPTGDFFGKYDGNGIVVTREVELLMDRGDNYQYYINILQSYNWWYWYSSGGGNITSSHLIESSITGIKKSEIIPQSPKLYQNFPNPFNPSTTIKFAIHSVKTLHATSLQSVSLKVYDILGREIKTLINEPMAPGSYEIKFNGSSLSSGIYIYRILSGNFEDSRKMALIK